MNEDNRELIIEQEIDVPDDDDALEKVKELLLFRKVVQTPTYLWTKVLMHLENRSSKDSIDTWFDDAEVIGLIDDTLVIYSPSLFSRQVIREKCMPHILEALNEIGAHSIRFEVWGDAELTAHRINTLLGNKPQFTFDNFIIDNANRNAANTLMTAAENHNATTPILLYGPSGSGKTHLLHAFSRSILQSSPKKHIVYVNSDQFTGEMIFSLRNDEMEQFYQKYYNTDVLLLDDIQHLADKKSVQEELSRIFNHLVHQKKRIILTFDRNPKEISIFENCLKDCFDSDILIKIG